VIAALWAEGELRRWNCGGRWRDISHRDDSRLLVGRQGVEEDFWGIEAEPAFGILIGLKVGVACLIIVGHSVVGLMVEGAV